MRTPPVSTAATAAAGWPVPTGSAARRPSEGRPGTGMHGATVSMAGTPSAGCGASCGAGAGHPGPPPTAGIFPGLGWGRDLAGESPWGSSPSLTNLGPLGVQGASPCRGPPVPLPWRGTKSSGGWPRGHQLARRCRAQSA